MKKKETALLLGFIGELYPRFMKNPTIATVDAWHEMLGDLDFETAKKTVKTHAQSSTFPPTIADIRAEHSSKKYNIPGYTEDGYVDLAYVAAQMVMKAPQDDV